ncbi:MAG: hypothetical protein AAF670_18025 [Planctomycetota bacterium]
MNLFPPYANISFRVAPINHADLDGSWDRIQQALSGRLTDWGKRLLRNGLSKHVGTVLIESEYLCRDFRSLHSNFYSRKFRPRTGRCDRLHFFSQQGLSADKILLGDADEGYIGASVIEPLATRCLGRTIIDPYKIGFDDQRFYCLATDFSHRIGGAEYKVRGFPYRSQDSEATVCAHTVLWSVARYLSQQYPTYAEVLPFDLVQLAGRRHGRVFPQHGMTFEDYSEILDHVGCHPLILSGLGNDGRPLHVHSAERRTFDDDLYAYVESGVPVICSFGDHVVSLIGHTAGDESVPDNAIEKADPDDDDLHGAAPEIEFVNSSRLIGQYVAIDDNEFPYRLVANEGGPLKESVYSRSVQEISTCVIPLPDETYLEPGEVRTYAKKLMSAREVRSVVARTLADDEISDLADGRPMRVIFRQLLTTGRALKKRKLEAWRRSERAGVGSSVGQVGPDQGLREPQQIALPQFVWLVEFSTVRLRSQNRVFGELLLDATAGETDLDYIFLRIGRYLARSIGRATTPRDPPTGLPLSRELHYSTFEPYRNNLGPYDG